MIKEAFKALQGVPESVTHADAVIDAFDACLTLGFSRLGPDQLEALESLARVFAGTPMGERVADTVDRLGRAEFMAEHFVTLAAARAALQGAQYDALCAHADQAFGKTTREVAVGEPAAVSDPVKVWMSSSQQWLMEIALAGFAQLEVETVVPFMATLEQLQEDGTSPRLAMLLTGMLNEWLDAMPIGAMVKLPQRRWADLWTRAMVSTLPGVPAATSATVSGTFKPLGMDLRHHPNVLSAVIYGVLEGKGVDAQIARVTASTYKVDLVVKKEMFATFHSNTFDDLFKAFDGFKAVDIKGMTLRSTGDLMWDGTAKLGKAFDPIAAAAEAMTLADPASAPTDRHPVQFARLIAIDGAKATADELGDGEVSLPLDHQRLSDTSELAGNMAGQKKVVALVRYDQGFNVQPLVATKSKKLQYTGSGSSGISRSSTTSVLEERASKLLRKKS